VALWLLVQPPGKSGESTLGLVQLTPSPAVSPAMETPRPFSTATPTTPVPTASPGTPGPTASPGAEATPTPKATPVPGEPLKYTVESGDSLLAFAAKFLPNGEDLTGFAKRIAQLNNLDDENPVIQPGDVLLIPR
jgi:hypothetical protein